MNTIKKIQVKNAAGETVTVDAALTNLYTNSKGNLCLETSDELDGTAAKGKINIEAKDDIQFKPGDDIIFYSHHRALDKQDEVALKITDGDDIPVKFQINAADVVLSTKDKTGTNANVMNVTVNAGKDERGYLKLRAQAIDLRSETHGGIALQPKGLDGDGHMNKIKFEHGGGDGLEFGTFNTERASLFTDEYRFNRDGIVKMATRVTEPSDKADATDPTTAMKYVKQEDDFYDVISPEDVLTTWKDIIKTAYAMNGGKNRHVKMTSGGNLEIAVNKSYIWEAAEDGTDAIDISTYPAIQFDKEFNSGDFEDLGLAKPVIGSVYKLANGQFYTCVLASDPKIKFDGTLNFGSTFNFGETDNGIEVLQKYTSKGKTKDCGVINILAVNNHASANFEIEGQTVAPGQEAVVASASLLDIVKLTNYFKVNNLGPWAPAE